MRTLERCSTRCSADQIDRGNPLALIELPRTWSLTELADGVSLGTLASRIEEGFSRRLDVLPSHTRLLLLTATTEPLGDPTLLWRAAERLGLGADPAAAAIASGLITFGRDIRFRHPLVRSAAYRLATPQERQAVHQALAEVTDPDVDPDRRAWHRAHTTSQPNEEIAAELERSAVRARARGGFFAAGASLENSAGLTLDPDRRAQRLLAAGAAKRSRTRSRRRWTCSRGRARTTKRGSQGRSRAATRRNRLRPGARPRGRDRHSPG